MADENVPLVFPSGSKGNRNHFLAKEAPLVDRSVNGGGQIYGPLID